MGLFLAGLALPLLGGVGALALSRSPRAASLAGAGGILGGCILGLVCAVRVLAGEALPPIRVPWDVPFASFSLEIDPLSAFFLVPLFVLSALAAIYGSGYLRAYALRKSLGPPWFFTNLLVVAMALLIAARNGVLFLVAWEVMSLASFFLVTFDDEREDVRAAGWTYLVATHLGTAFLLVLFILLGRGSGSLDFDTFRAGAAPGVLFLLALIGFGTKAGFMPFHVWLPEAHPAAPSHVSALLSGVMIKTGIYGLLRTLTWLGSPPAWWGWLLVAIGAISGVVGILFALAQRDLKRLLAYSSVENMGIIALGLGLAVLGRTYGAPGLAALGLAGALLHVLNHALFKGLLFMGAGAVLHSAGGGNVDRLGGLLKKMPVTALAFLAGAVAISGLPPFNGFVSEFLIALGAYRGGLAGLRSAAVPALVTIAGLALIAGLAAACFTRTFGLVFLGEPRDTGGHDPGWAMRAPMLFLATCCAAIGLFPQVAFKVAAPVIREVLPMTPSGWLPQTAASLQGVVGVSLVFLVLVAFLAALRYALLRRRPVDESVTWDCGYVRPTARMQYTSTSFAQPLTGLFSMFLRSRQRLDAPQGYFPAHASASTETPDVCRERLYRPAFLGVAWALSKFRWLQIGRVHLYVLYIALTLLIFLAWKLA